MLVDSGDGYQNPTIDFSTNKVSPSASWSLAFGLCSLLFTFLLLGGGHELALALSIPAIILGHVGLVRIRHSQGKQKGRLEAIMGLCLGYAVTLFCVISVSIFGSHSVHSRLSKVQAMRTSMELVNAIVAFKGEYRRWPKTQTLKGDTKVATDDSNGLMAMLVGVSPGPDLNRLGRRHISFFSAKKARHKTSQGLYVDHDKVRLNDPWGNPFIVIYDTSYDGEIEVPQPDGSLSILSSQVAVISRGRDGKVGTKDDILAIEQDGLSKSLFAP